LGPWWTEQQCGYRHGSAPGVTCLQSSSARAVEEKGDEAEPMRGSPKLER
jgi:hypothetical protein